MEQKIDNSGSEKTRETIPQLGNHKRLPTGLIRTCNHLLLLFHRLPVAKTSTIRDMTNTTIWMNHVKGEL